MNRSFWPTVFVSCRCLFIFKILYIYPYIQILSSMSHQQTGSRSLCRSRFPFKRMNLLTYYTVPKKKSAEITLEVSLRLPHACHDQRDSMGGLETSILPVAIRGCFPLLDFMDWFRGTSTGNQSFYRFLKCQLFKKKRICCRLSHDPLLGCNCWSNRHSFTQFFSVLLSQAPQFF